MDVEGLVLLIEQYGYIALFFSLWLGIVGMPIPDEVVVMTGGLAVSLGLLQYVPSFIVTYLGVVSGLSLGYFIGRIMGEPALKRLRKKKNIDKYLAKSQRLMDRYGSYALCFSYFFPIVRHLVPYLVGVNKMSFLRYALISYTTGLVWTFIFFAMGILFGNYIEQIGEIVYTYGLYTLISLLIIGVGIWIYFFRRNQSDRRRNVQ